MKNNFREKKLSEILIFKNGKSIKPGGEGQYPVFGSNGLIGKCDTYKEENGVIIGRVGAYCGSINFHNSKFWASDNTIVAYPRNSNEGHTKFFYYLLKFLNLNRWAGGAAQPLLTQSVLNSIEAKVPSLKTQCKIVSILSAYDDLIENNLRRIQILEEMAQNLYREWFVKFRFPGHENTQFVESELGRIPEGWEVIPLQELISKHIGGGWGKETFDTKHTEPGWVIRGTDIPKARHCNLDSLPFRYHTTSNLRSRKLEPGDIVFEVSGGSKDQPLGRTMLISEEMFRTLDGYPAICASFCKRIQPKSDIYAPEVLYLSFLDAYSTGEIEQFQVQSTGISNYKWSDYIEKVNRCVPKTELQEHFREAIAPVLSKIAILGLKNRNLRKTRDLLLPKLISGEVDVSELDIETLQETPS